PWPRATVGLGRLHRLPLRALSVARVAAQRSRRARRPRGLTSIATERGRRKTMKALMRRKDLVHAGMKGAVILASCAPARAGDVKLIRQAAFPIVIDTPGSYRLKSNLVVTGANAIEIRVDDVTIDLNGYTISGPVVCSDVPVTCTPAAVGQGIS